MEKLKKRSRSTVVEEVSYDGNEELGTIGEVSSSFGTDESFKGLSEDNYSLNLDDRSSSTSEASDNSERMMRKLKFKDTLTKDVFSKLKKEIARNISIGENREKLRKVLQISLNKRSEEDIQELIKAIQNLEFFKAKQNKLSLSDLKELACSLEYKKIK